MNPYLFVILKSFDSSIEHPSKKNIPICYDYKMIFNCKKTKPFG